MTLLTVLALSLFAAELVALALALAIRAAVPSLAALPKATAPARWPTLSVIVPAKDEAAHIEAALRSKLACGYPALQVVVVDDRSTDNTAQIVEGIAAQRQRAPAAAELVVTRVTSLPEGWLGKLHALHHGLAAANGEWVLFADADVHLAPETLERLIAHAESEKIDFMGVFPKMEPVGIVVDACLAGLLRALALSGRAWRANDDRSGLGLGVGAFNLARRRWLEETHALEHLRMEIADDVALGAYLKQCGARTRFYAGREAVSLVFMPDVPSMVRSADKGGGMFGWSAIVPLLAAAGPIAVELALPLAAMRVGGLGAGFAAAALACATATHLVLSAHFAGPLRGALLWPVGHFVNAAGILHAGWLAWRRQGVVWRGTFYSRAVLDKGRRLDPRTMRVRPWE